MAELDLQPVPEKDPHLGVLRQHFSELVTAATRTTEMLSINRFPGTMALTLSRRHLGMICQNDYVILEKSDGTRYMLLATAQFVFLIDRLMKFYIIEPNPRVIEWPDVFKPQEDTVLDGELIFNRVTEQWEFLIYDAVSINGDINVATMDYRARMTAAETFVVGPRVIASFSTGLLRLRIKDYYEKQDIRKLFSRVKKNPRGEYLYINDDRRDGVVCNHNDGVVFTPVRMGYVVKNCAALLKWKPPHLNSIDFLLKLERIVDHRRNEPSVKSSIAYRGDNRDIVLREVFFPSKLKRQWANEFSKYHNSIVELSYDRMAGEWRYIRQREDKNSANFASTVIDTMESIAESMEREELVRFVEKNSRQPPANAMKYITAQAKNEKLCTVRGDLFDADNKAYLVTTPVSLTAPPIMQRPRSRPFSRKRQRHGVQDGSQLQEPNVKPMQNPNAYSSSKRARPDDAKQGPSRSLRQQPDYSDDV